MANIDCEEVIASEVVPMKNDSTNDVESEPVTFERVNPNVEGKVKEESLVDLKKEEIVSGKTGGERKKRKRKRKLALGSTNDKDSMVVEEPSSSKKVSRKKVESSGMIFMCNSKTKKDCYHYKVLGLPASKKDVVSKIYKGMRLFLFDIDLKLLYGIYKAAGPGGDNIEPKAFKSAYPSQVRFTVLEDCLPLAEEKFKKVIKDNYYTRNKFNCQLTSEQVKNLCKVFQVANKGLKPKSSGRNLTHDTQPIIKNRRPVRLARAIGADTHTYVHRNRTRLLDWQERPRPYNGGSLIYEREALASPVALFPQHFSEAPPPLVALPHRRPLPMESAGPRRAVYAYDRLEDTDPYGRGYSQPENPKRRHLGQGCMLQDEIEHSDRYIVRREPPLYHERVSSVGRVVEYYHPLSPAPELPPRRPSYQY